MSASDAVKEVIWRQDLLIEIHLTDKKKTTLYQDNQGAYIPGKE
jgi:hypothetical protein